MRTKLVRGVDASSPTCWTDDDRLALLTYDAVRLYDSGLQRVRLFRGWQAGSTACDGIRAVGVWCDGRLRELTLASGKLRFAPRLPSPAVGLVTAVR